MRSLKLAFLMLFAFFSSAANADVMTVRNLKEVLQLGPTGEVVVTSYVQGVVDGMLAIESMQARDHATPREFCKIHEAQKAGVPIQHPAYRAVEIVNRWEAEGLPLEALAVDMVLSFLDSQYGCK
jgi:hypothetical protein